MYFLSFRSFEQLALALKSKFALKFYKPGGAAAPPPMMSITKLSPNTVPTTRAPLLSLVTLLSLEKRDSKHSA